MLLHAEFLVAVAHTASDCPCALYVQPSAVCYILLYLALHADLLYGKMLGFELLCQQSLAVAVAGHLMQPSAPKIVCMLWINVLLMSITSR